MEVVKLILVYNANSGIKNAILDGMHKVLSPSTYECNLCDITFGWVAEKRTWKNFRQQSGLQMEFLHKDEFEKQYASKFGHKFTFPIALAEGTNDLEVVISTEEINGLKRAEELIDLIEQRTAVG